MTAVGRQENAVIEIDGKPYQIGKDENGAPQYRPRSFPTQEGDPTVPRRWVYDDWSKGLGDSQGTLRGTVEYGFAFLGMPGRILPPPLVTVITGGHDAAITAFVVVTAPANRVISVGGRYAKEIDPSAHTVSTTSDLLVSCLDACHFGTTTAFALGDSTRFRYRNAAGTYAANTLTGNLGYARAFGLSKTEDGITGLVRGRAYRWSKCTAADFYGTDGNWGTEYDVGAPDANVTQVGAYSAADYVLKEDGVYTFFAQSSAASNVLPVLASFKNSANKRWFVKDNRLFICSYAGLYRLFHNGPAKAVGIETNRINENAMANVYPTAGVAMGGWQYVAYYLTSTDTTYITMEREAEDGDGTFSPITSVCVIRTFTGVCNAMIIPANVTTTPELWWAEGTNIAYMPLTRDGRPSTYATSGTTRVAMPPTDFGTPLTLKYFKGVEGIFRNLSATKTVTIKAKMDEGSENTVGAAMTSATRRRAAAYWTLNSNDVGISTQIIAEMANDSTSAPPEIRKLAVMFEERPVVVEGFEAVVTLRDWDGDRRSVLEQRQALEAILDGSPVSITDMDGTTFTGAVFPVDGETQYQTGAHALPQGSVSIGVRKLSYAD